jgi:hypothetical protein
VFYSAAICMAAGIALFAWMVRSPRTRKDI